ncbi:Major facilitator superfamily domain,Major facilitator, sugar transporter-like [Cinara cedri]|uniref:Major facilitator superfamily domain,Major facilitator, sugar transporter-like n=1 Tax=Cinara cedri TaxID=506608 RepID=A0A5E4N2F0_9HEMI|nr:Major facilitator superfamily domain,Major facilitator, sugar transporter-like [Cinara cedri]
MSKKGVFRQIYVTVVATLTIFISGMWLGWPSSVVEKAMKHEIDINVTMDELSWIVAMMDLGNMISPLFAGYLMDKLAGVKIRGALSSTFCIQLHFGFLLEAVVGPLVKYRTLNTMSAVFPVVFTVLAFWIPESPYYLLKKNRRVEAARCLQWYRCEQDDVKLTDELRQMEVNVEREMENQSTFREVFTSPKDRKALGIVVAACITQRAGGISCILAFFSLILPEPAPVFPRFQYMIVFATTIVVITITCATLVDKVGRKPLLIISEVGLGIISAGFTVYFYMGTSLRFVIFPYALFLLFSVMYSVGVGFIPVVYLGEMFSVNIRSHCSSIASIALASSSFATNKIFLFVSRTYGNHAMFFLFTVVNFAGALYSYKYAIETKGKTLLEIQQILEEKVKKAPLNTR